MTELVLIDRAVAGVAVVTLNRPEKYNALSLALLRAFDVVMTELNAEQGLRAIVLTGADPAFCAGLDLNELGDGGRVLSGAHAADPLHNSTVPVIAAVNGVAVTGGLEI